MFGRLVRTRPAPARPASLRQLTRRALLCRAALATLASVALPASAQHGTMGLVSPPLRLADNWLVDQTGRKRRLSELLLEGVTAVQTIYTGCSSVCPLQGALFSAIQERIPHLRGRQPVRLLSIGIDPLADTPAALHAWLMRFEAGPNWSAATPALPEVDRMRTALSGSALPLRNLADHSTQIYCFDARAMLRWRSTDLPRADEVCDVLGALARI